MIKKMVHNKRYGSVDLLLRLLVELLLELLLLLLLLQSYRMIPDWGRGASGSSACFCGLGRRFGALLGLSVNLLVPLERFVFDFGSSDPDFTRRGSPQDALGIVFGGQNEETSRTNRVEKHVFFHIDFFRVFLRFLMILAPFWEALASPKIEKNCTRRPKNEFWGVSWTHLFSRMGLGRV